MFGIKKFLLVFTGLIFLSSGAQSSQIKSDFHLPKNEAEKALDRIFLANSSENSKLFNFLMDPVYKRKSDISIKEVEYFSKLLTENFINTVRQTEFLMLNKNCAGKDEGYTCGMEVNPVICAQDYYKEGNLFKTIEQKNGAVVIKYFNSHFNEGEPKEFFKMKYEKDSWMLDETSCVTYYANLHKGQKK